MVVDGHRDSYRVEKVSDNEWTVMSLDPCMDSLGIGTSPQCFMYATIPPLIRLKLLALFTTEPNAEGRWIPNIGQRLTENVYWISGAVDEPE